MIKKKQVHDTIGLRTRSTNLTFEGYLVKHLKLAAHQLYILSGPQASGKSTFLKKGLESGHLSSDMILSSDQYRNMLMGSVPDLDPSGTAKLYPRSHADHAVFSMMKLALEARMAERMTTFIDATNVNESDRNAWALIADKYNIQSEILVFSAPDKILKERNRSRVSPVPDAAIDLFNERFSKTQEALERGTSQRKIPFRKIPEEGATPELVLNTLPHDKIDVIGDVHGLGEDLVQFLVTLGYCLKNEAFVHDQGRKLLFLGDFIDRGPDSINVLRLVMNSVQKEGHFAVMGNHEKKLLQFEQSLKAGAPEARSLSSAETAMAWLRLPEKERTQLIEFIKSLPGYYVHEKVAFFHAPVSHFDPLKTPIGDLLYGTQEKNAEEIYQSRYDNGLNTYTVFRGHIEQKEPKQNMFSLERDQAFAGHLAAIPFDKWKEESQSIGNIKAFNSQIKTWKCHFNFDHHKRNKFKLWNELRRLKDEKLVYANVDPGTGMTLFKFSKDVFWNAKWGESPALSKARGLVMDLAGNIVQHPFDKIFNRKENGTGDDWSPDRKVIAVDKLNGFLGCIGWDPFRNDLLITTTGSFDSDFVGHIKSLLDPKTAGKMKGFLSRNPSTLMFEVLHPSDPHIIHYPPEMMGLHLIGGRDLDESSPHWTEETLDTLAKELGLRRPQWRIMPYGNVLESVQTLRHEGYVIRNAETNVPEMKIKTPYYLTTKFLGRLSANKVKHMFAKPANFKQTIDEEFYGIVDVITSTFKEAEFLAMDDADRIVFIRKTIEPLYRAKEQKMEEFTF